LNTFNSIRAALEAGKLFSQAEANLG